MRSAGDQGNKWAPKAHARGAKELREGLSRCPQGHAELLSPVTPPLPSHEFGACHVYVGLLTCADIRLCPFTPTPPDAPATCACSGQRQGG